MESGRTRMDYETRVDPGTGSATRLGSDVDTGDPSGSAFAGDDDRLDGETRRSGRRTILIVAVIVVLLGALVAYVMLREDGAAAAPADDDGQLQRVTVIAPGRTTIEGTITATGTLAARRSTPVGVVGEGGRVVAVGAEAGQWVNQGEVLVSIDRSVQNQTAAAARAQIGVAQADLDIAQSNLDRALQLVERGFISTADVDRLTATRDSARARVEVARAQYNELLARNARLDVVAPVSGLVLERNVEPGQTVSAGSPPLFTIARGGEMELMAQVSETDLAQLAPGVSATVTIAGSDREYTGQVWQIAPLISETNRQGTARIALSYAEGLRPGGFATARISSGTLAAPLLPESAVLNDDDGSYVYIVNSDNEVVRRPVELGLVTPDGIAIASGLSGTERVVLRAGGFLNAGETVRPVTQDE